MKVKELIAKLQKFDGEIKVSILSMGSSHPNDEFSVDKEKVDLGDGKILTRVVIAEEW
jgi:hypothetical protein